MYELYKHANKLVICKSNMTKLNQAKLNDLIYIFPHLYLSNSFKENIDILIVDKKIKANNQHIDIFSHDLQLNIATNLAQPTVKYYLALSLGKIIISSDWIHTCIANKKIVDPLKFEINGDTINGITYGAKTMRLLRKSSNIFF